MYRLAANISGAVRKAKLHGEDYLVAPLTLIVEGVLNGSEGPVYYPADELAGSATAWNNVPIVLGHPVDDQGNYVGPCTPEVLEKFGLGQVFNPRLIKNSLKAEGWFNVNRTKQVAPSLLPALRRGNKVELSTGLGIQRQAEEGTFNNRRYNGVARNHRPYHLAILLNEPGACSVHDGCGVNNRRNKTGTKVKTRNQRSQSMATKLDRKKMIETLVANCGCKEDVVEKLDDDMLQTLNKAPCADKVAKLEAQIKAQETVLNAAKKGFKIGDDEYALNEKGECVKMPGKMEKEGHQVANAGKPATPAAPISLEDWLTATNAPEEVRNAVMNARQIQDREREQLIANIKTSQRNTYTDEQLNKLPLEDEKITTNGREIAVVGLRSLSQALAPQEFGTPAIPSYLGAAVRNASTGEKAIPLGLPRWDFSAAKAK